MSDIFTTILTSLQQYMYPEYVLAVLLLTALVRRVFIGIDRVIHPKWITLIVGIILAGFGFGWRTIHNEEFKIFKVVISFGIATLGYDYFWKVLQDKITKPKL